MSGSTLTPADILVDTFFQGFPATLDFSISHALRPSCNLAGVEVENPRRSQPKKRLSNMKRRVLRATGNLFPCVWKQLALCVVR